MRSLRTLRFLLGTGSIILFCVIGTAATASAGEPQTNQQWVSDRWTRLGPASGGDGVRILMHVRHAGPSKCLGIALPSRQGASAILWDCDGHSAQSFTQHDNRDRSWTFSVVDKTTGARYCLDANNSGHANGARVAFKACIWSVAQKWVIGREDQLQSVQSPGKCLDDTDRATKNGTKMQTWDCAGNPGAIPTGIQAGVPAPAEPQAASEKQRQAAPKAKPAQTRSPDKTAGPSAKAGAAESGVPSTTASTPAARASGRETHTSSTVAPALPVSRPGSAKPAENVSPIRTVATAHPPLTLSLAAFVIISGLVVWRLVPWPLALAVLRRRGAAVIKRLGTTAGATVERPAQRQSARPAKADEDKPQLIDTTKPEQVRTLSSGMIVPAPRFPREVAEIAPWWTPDQDLFPLIVSYDAAKARFRDGTSFLSPLELAHRLSEQAQWDKQPIMLITDGDPSGSVVQLIADYLQAPVITGSHPGLWLAVSPRRADRGRSPVIHLGREYPFTQEQKTKLKLISQLQRVLPPTRAVSAVEADERGCALVAHDQPGADELLDGLHRWRSDAATADRYGVAVQTDTEDPDWPIRVGDDLRTVWDAAEALWETREHWQDEKITPTVLTTSPMPRQDLQLGLLSAYLQTPVCGAHIPDCPVRPTDLVQARTPGIQRFPILRPAVRTTTKQPGTLKRRKPRPASGVQVNVRHLVRRNVLRFRGGGGWCP
ncbi:RICIN domain-containing protein [Streptomyces sp. NBC_00151]|uniref:RICIN domain-containing protein n=1 Tax=Streptomyces sp. NBC_00151 TaxID=2975669 RepID=UPI002DDBD51F|nr:RICIN domain-containing protein [Streptomyces sp. NBC_00151]WRZ36777.1 RICIN domain-containing protein [Streptomyces sp. NBC_00151]WRZ44800.1 RICIN domain-containing protein [Streptomyces sp. NBC_00151]